MGLATAELLASRGALLSLADVNAQAVQRAANSLSRFEGQHLAIVVDVRISKEEDAWMTATVENFGELDGALNMAGIIKTAKPITKVTDDEWDMTFTVNTKGVFKLPQSTTGSYERWC